MDRSIDMTTYLLRNSVFVVMIKYFGCKNEEVFYVFAGLRRGLEAEEDAAISLELLDSVGRDLALLLLVFFISNQEKNDIRLTLRHHLIIPRCQIIECLQSRYIVC